MLPNGKTEPIDFFQLDVIEAVVVIVLGGFILLRWHELHTSAPGIRSELR